MTAGESAYVSAYGPGEDDGSDDGSGEGSGEGSADGSAEGDARTSPSGTAFTAAHAGPRGAVVTRPTPRMTTWDSGW